MPEERLSRLLTLVPPPPEGGSPIDWAIVEASLGFGLPGDYKALIEVYGLGAFDGFLWLLHPTASNPNLRLDREIMRTRAALKAVADPFAPPDALVSWAITEGGEVCYWIMDDDRQAPDSWGIAVNESRGPEWVSSELQTIDWLEAVFSGTLRIPVFPDDFPSRPPKFQRLADER